MKTVNTSFRETILIVTRTYFLILFSFSVFASSTMSVDSISYDTIMAIEFLENAKYMEENIEYDSSIFYFRKAAEIYKKYKAWDRYVESLLGIVNGNLGLSNLDTALFYCKDALFTVKQHFNENHPKKASTYFYFGRCQYQKGNYDKALEYHTKCLNIQTKIWKEDNLKTADSYNNIGNCYGEKGNSDKELEYYNKALEIRIKLLNDIHPLIASSFNNIGTYHSEKGNSDEALEYHYKALNIRLKSLKKNHPHIAYSYTNIGVCYDKKGNYDKALNYHMKALKIWVISLKRNHPRIAQSYNNIGNCYQEKGNYNKALEYYYKALKIRVKDSKEIHPKTANVYNNIGNCYKKMGKYKKALEYHKTASEIRIKNFGEYHPLVANSYNGIGNCYYEKGNYDKALEYYFKALNIRIKTSGKDHPRLDWYYNNIGNCYDKKGDNDKALDYHYKALNVLIKTQGENHPRVAYFYHGIGSCYSNKGNDNKALEYYKKSLNILIKTKGESHPEVANCHNNIGNCYQTKGKCDLALKHHRKALKIWVNSLGKNYPFVAHAYTNIGNCYFDKGSYDKALKYLNKALDIRFRTLEKNHPDVASSYVNIGNCYKNKGNFNAALVQYQKALIQLCNTFEDTEIVANPQLKDISSKVVLLKALKAKAETLSEKYENSQSIEDLKLSFSTFELTTSLLDSMRLEFMSTISKQSLMDKYMSVYNNAIKQAFLLYQQTCEKDVIRRAFMIAEKSKAFLLLQAIKTNRAKRFANIPDTLLTMETENNQTTVVYEKWLKKEHRILDSLKIVNEWRPDTILVNGKIKFWQNKIFNLKQQRDSLVTFFEKNYPNYYKLKYDLHVASVEQAQEQLTNHPNKALLEYFVEDTSLYIFCVTRDDINLYEIKKDSLFDQALNQYLKCVSKNTLENQQSTFTAYTNAAYYLYQQLIEKPLEKLSASINELIIIPDGQLGYVSFSSLISKSVEKPVMPYQLNKLQYLIKDYTVSYGYSLTLLLENVKPKLKDKSKYQLSAFAPSFGEKIDSAASYASRGCKLENLYDLPFAKEEIKEILKNVKGISYLNREATKENFLKIAPYSRILHVATHACVEDGDPMYSKLFFYNDGIQTYELFNIQLNADLVVLSACETGAGEIQRGEGIMSLSRGFTYTDCTSLVMSLWSVNDKSTSEIMVHFYKNLKKGQTKDKALRNAQLAFLNNPGLDPDRAHPFFWAAFVPMGNMEAIDLSGSRVNSYIIWISVGILTVFLLLYYILVNGLKRHLL